MMNNEDVWAIAYLISLLRGNNDEARDRANRAADDFDKYKRKEEQESA